MSTAHEQLVLGPELAGTLMTTDEFDSAEVSDEFYVYELINGVLVVTPPPSAGERGPNELLGNLLYIYRHQHPQGSALDYTLTEHTIPYSENRRRADRVIWAGLGRTPNVRNELPMIVIEFVSEGKRNRQRDYITKRDEYLRLGIQEYWIIDRFHRTMTVACGPADNSSEVIIAEEGLYSSPLLPGFELQPGRLFAEADLLKKASDESTE